MDPPRTAMRRRGQPPRDSEGLTTLNRVLAEMVVARPPPTQGPARAAAKTTKAEAKGKNEAYVKVKAEPGEPAVKLEQDAAPPPLGAPVAMSLVDFSFVLGLVFGGCCSNVYTYEYLLKIDSRMGTALTFSQMAFVTLQSLPSFLTLGSGVVPRLKPRQVPLSQWALQVLVLTAGSLLNNWAFAFQVPLTVQIVFRSAGLAVSMLFGRLFLNKQYTFSQVASVLFVTLGVVLATTSRPTSVQDTSQPVDVTQYTIGVSMLTVSLLLTGVLGLLQEKTYTRYGPCWKEGLFYTHALSLPIFLLFIPNVQHGFRSLRAATLLAPDAASMFASATYPPALQKALVGLTPLAPYLMLGSNLITQLVCVSGVNQLTSRVSSVSTNLVLTTRKAISLCFSVWWFGNGWNEQLGVGAGMVFLGSILYTIVTSRSPAPKAAPAKTALSGQRHKRE